MDDYLKGMVEEPAEDKRYIISKVGSLGRPISTCSITESELRRRCVAMCSEYEKHGTVKIDILLHGEIGPGFSKPGAQTRPSPEDIIRMRNESKPSTRQDWENWLVDMIHTIMKMPGILKE